MGFKLLMLQVTSPYGNTIHNKEQVSQGHFALTTKEPGNYLACFWMDSKEKGMGGNVNLDWKIGIATRDWDAIARMEKIQVFNNRKIHLYFIQFDLDKLKKTRVLHCLPVLSDELSIDDFSVN